MVEPLRRLMGSLGIGLPGPRLQALPSWPMSHAVGALRVMGPGAWGSDGTTTFSVPSCRHHYILLVFLKVPILLLLVAAVLWLKGSQQRPSI